MNVSKYHNAIIVFVFLIFVLSGVFLFIKLHNLILVNEGLHHTGQMYWLFTIGFISGFSLFAYALTNKKVIAQHVEYNTEKSTLEDTANNDTGKTKITTDADTADVEELVSSIIPQQDLLNDNEKYCEKLLINLSKEIEIVQGVVFLLNASSDEYHPVATYAYFKDEPPKPFNSGETLPGQVARNKNLLLIDDVPDGYVNVVSGLGTSSPKHLLIFPVLNDDKVIGILELASFKTFDNHVQSIINKLSEKLKEPFTSLI